VHKTNDLTIQLWRALNCFLTKIYKLLRRNEHTSALQIVLHIFGVVHTARQLIKPSIGRLIYRHHIYGRFLRLKSIVGKILFITQYLIDFHGANNFVV